jgi:hypothetical protein
LYIISIYKFATFIASFLPKFYSGLKEGQVLEVNKIYSVPLVGIAYLSLAVTQVVGDFRALPGIHSQDIRKQRPECLFIAQLYYSTTFPIGFGDFCLRIADSLETSTA